MEVIFIVWLVVAIIIGVAARSRGRSGFGWFLVAVILTPVLAALLLLLFPTRIAPPDPGRVGHDELERNIRRNRQYDA